MAGQVGTLTQVRIGSWARRRIGRASSASAELNLTPNGPPAATPVRCRSPFHSGVSSWRALRTRRAVPSLQGHRSALKHEACRNRGCGWLCKTTPLCSAGMTNPRSPPRLQNVPARVSRAMSSVISGETHSTHRQSPCGHMRHRAVRRRSERPRLLRALAGRHSRL